MDRKQLIVIAALIVAVLFFSGRFVKKRKDMKSEYQSNVRILSNIFPEWVLRDMERMYRIETANFKSGQFKGTFSPGMETFGKTYPYGWNTISRVVWERYPAARPTGKLWTGTEGGTGLQKSFLVFPHLLAAMTTVAGFITHYKNAARWYSTKPESQERYAASLAKFKTTWTDEALK